MSIEKITVPDLGGAENVDLIEISVKVGDSVEVDSPLIVLESDKASMDIPSPKAGKVVSIAVKEGDKLNQGDLILELETAATGDVAEEPAAKAEPAPAAAPSAAAAEFAVDVPDIGGAENVDVIEVSVKVGDQVEEGDSLIVLESDKASMDVPAPKAGKVIAISIKEGDKVSQGSAILTLEVAGAAPPAPSPSAAKAQAPVAAPAAVSSELAVVVPDIGGAENVDVIEVCVKAGDEIAEGDSIIVLESDKASMEVPSPASGKVVSVALKEGDKVNQGNAILTLAVAGAAAPSSPPSAPAQAPEKPVTSKQKPQRTTELFPQEIQSSGSEVYAGPAVRKLARELGVVLTKVKGTGPRNRISKDDVKAFVKGLMQGGVSTAGAEGSAIPKVPAVDFSKFGNIELVKMSKIKKVTAANMSRNWLNAPHVTQFDEADITNLEEFRGSMKLDAEKAGVKLTPLPFLLKACAMALKAEPNFNVSLHDDGEHMVYKKYVHIGVAVDTPNGLFVPVIKDVDKKGLFDLAREATLLAGKAREGKLLPSEMQGGCFTISSLGPIGGTGFTPIVNVPEVAILGVSKAQMKPMWNGKEFLPRLMLPLCLSYDHRAVNGADAGKFITYLSALLADLRRLLV